MCTNLAMNGHRSYLSNSLTIVSKHFNFNQLDISNVKISETPIVDDNINNNVHASVIKELLNMKCNYLSSDMDRVLRGLPFEIQGGLGYF